MLPCTVRVTGSMPLSWPPSAGASVDVSPEGAPSSGAVVLSGAALHAVTSSISSATVRASHRLVFMKTPSLNDLYCSTALGR